jgi:hypothetical protein
MRSLVVSLDDLLHSTLVENELGLEFSGGWRIFFDKAKARDVLDFVTVAYRYLARQQYTGEARSRQWLRDVQRIFVEENVHYRVDARGGVHFHFDEEFARVTAAAISLLQSPRYANSLDAFNKSLAALAEAPPDGKTAIRATFTAIEGLFCLMFPDLYRLAAHAPGLR